MMFRVFIGYPSHGGCKPICDVEAHDQDAAEEAAYLVWLAWGERNSLDQSNFYTEEV